MTSEVCAANLTATMSEVDAPASVINADATEPDLLGSLAAVARSVAVFVDPSRRGSTRPVDGSRARPERDPERWSPPWSFIDSLRSHFDFVAAKAPASFVPSAAWACEWLSVRDHIVGVLCVFHGAAGLLATHQATLLSTSPTQRSPTPLTCCTPSHPSSAQPPPAGPLEDYLESPTQFSVTRWQHCAAPTPMWSTRTVIDYQCPTDYRRSPLVPTAPVGTCSHSSRTPRTITASMRSPSSVESQCQASALRASESIDHLDGTGTPSLWPADSTTCPSLSESTSRPLTASSGRQRT